MGEAGDFQLVEIKANNQKILQLDNQDGWVTLPSPLCPVDWSKSILRTACIHNYFSVPDRICLQQQSRISDIDLAEKGLATVASINRMQSHRFKSKRYFHDKSTMALL